MSRSTGPYPVLTELGLSAPDGVDVAYENLLADVLANGTAKSDRTGTGTRSLFARQLRYDLRRGFPRITTKFVAMKAVKGELLWFLRGETNVRWLQERGITIWDEWADENGDLGLIYSHQWRSWPDYDGGAIDQLAQVIDLINRCVPGRKVEIGRIEIGRDSSYFEVERDAARRVADSMNSYEVDGRPISVSPMHDDDADGDRGDRKPYRRKASAPRSYGGGKPWRRTPDRKRSRR